MRCGDSWSARSLRGLQRELSVELNAGVVKVTGKVVAPAREQRDLVMPLQRALRQVGERAAKRGSGLLLTIDEAQTVPLDALSDLGMIIQTVAHRDALPIAFVFAGTPELGEILLRSGSFLERMPRTELRMLTVDETRLALLEPAAAHGVVWSTEALDTVAAAADGYPYFVQVGGEQAWHAAHGASSIKLRAGEAGAAAIAERADQMFRDRWKRLGPAQQRYLAAAAAGDPRRDSTSGTNGRDRGRARQASDAALAGQSKPDRRTALAPRQRLRTCRVRLPALCAVATRPVARWRGHAQSSRPGAAHANRPATPTEQRGAATGRPRRGAPSAARSPPRWAQPASEATPMSTRKFAATRLGFRCRDGR